LLAVAGLTEERPVAADEIGVDFEQVESRVLARTVEGRVLVNRVAVGVDLAGIDGVGAVVGREVGRLAMHAAEAEAAVFTLGIVDAVDQHRLLVARRVAGGIHVGQAAAHPPLAARDVEHGAGVGAGAMVSKSRLCVISLLPAGSVSS